MFIGSRPRVGSYSKLNGWLNDWMRITSFSLCLSTFLYLKFLVVWALVLLADFVLEFRFEYLWPFWLFIRSVYDSFRYQGLVSVCVCVCVCVCVSVCVWDQLFKQIMVLNNERNRNAHAHVTPTQNQMFIRMSELQFSIQKHALWFILLISSKADKKTLEIRIIFLSAAIYLNALPFYIVYIIYCKCLM